MKVVRYEQVENAKADGQLGIETKDSVVIPCFEISKKHNLPIVNSINELISNWNENVIRDLDQLICDMEGLDMKNIRILTPIPWPLRNVFCLGKNYMDHAKELENKGDNLQGIPEFPMYFTKTASPAIGPDDVIGRFPDLTDGDVDYEVELAVIIGKQGVNIKKEDAESYIFGYTVLNDVSARTLQIKHGQWFRGKCLDTHTVIGPAIVHKSKFAFPPSLNLGTRVNGEIRQNGNTDMMIFDIATIISDLSRETTLYPGDIISTGTPSGVGMGFNPPRYLKHGDVVECWVEGIGTLKNSVSDFI